MSFPLSFSRIILAVLVGVFAAQWTEAQAQQQHDWIPKGIEALRQSASSKTEFTLDHSMLVFAAKMDPNNQDLQRVIAGVNGVSVHSYRFPRTWTYDPAALNSVKDEYEAAGWKRLMNKQEKDGGPGVTDLWVRLENNAIRMRRSSKRNRMRSTSSWFQGRSARLTSRIWAGISVSPSLRAES